MASNFLSYFDPKNFKGKRVCIVETVPCNVDFFINDLLTYIPDLSLYSFYEPTSHYKVKDESRIKSIYEFDYSPSSIVDDIWTGVNLFNRNFDANFYVYRANTCNGKDLYDYDLCIEVKPLKSGFSTLIDGSITMYCRNDIFLELKYKAKGSATEYML